MLIGTKARPTEDQIKPVLESGIEYLEAVLIKETDLDEAFRLHDEGKIKIAGFDPKKDEAWKSVYERQDEIRERGLYVSTDGYSHRIAKLNGFNGIRAIENLPSTAPMTREHKAHDFDYLAKVTREMKAEIALDVNHLLQSAAYLVSTEDEILPIVTEEVYEPHPSLLSQVNEEKVQKIYQEIPSYINIKERVRDILEDKEVIHLNERNYRTYFDNPRFSEVAFDSLEKLVDMVKSEEAKVLHWASVGEHRYVHKGLSSKIATPDDIDWTYDPPVSFNGQKMYPVTFKTHLPFGEGDLHQIADLRNVFPYLRNMGVKGLIIEINMPFKNSSQLKLEKRFLERELEG